MEWFYELTQKFRVWIILVDFPSLLLFLCFNKVVESAAAEFDFVGTRPPLTCKRFVCTNTSSAENKTTCTQDCES